MLAHTSINYLSMSRHFYTNTITSIHQLDSTTGYRHYLLQYWFETSDLLHHRQPCPALHSSLGNQGTMVWKPWQPCSIHASHTAYYQMEHFSPVKLNFIVGIDRHLWTINITMFHINVRVLFIWTSHDYAFLLLDGSLNFQFCVYCKTTRYLIVWGPPLHCMS